MALYIRIAMTPYQDNNAHQERALEILFETVGQIRHFETIFLLERVGRIQSREDLVALFDEGGNSDEDTCEGQGYATTLFARVRAEYYGA